LVVAAKVIKVEAVEEQVAESQGTVTRKTKKETCVHHWLIEEAKKPTSTGRCKKCHEVKEFNNDIDSGSEFTGSPKPYGGKTK
jgi:hypothetical protein